MLKFILGRQKMGKTFHCTKLAEELVNLNKNVIMLVPEQYSFECQKNLLDTLGPQKSNCVIIHSFTSLCEEIMSVNGGLSGYNVDDSTRYILVGQAIKNVKDSLKIYAKYSESTSFINQMLSIFTEFKQTAVTFENLKNIIDGIESNAFADKLHDISLIYSAYDALLTSKFIDPLDFIDRTVQGMLDNSFFKGKTVIVDEFKGFTESQLKLMDRVIAGSENVYVSLCCDSLVSKGETDLFANVKKAGRRLRDIASSHGITVSEEVVENKNFSDDILALESFLSENSQNVFDASCDNVKICAADSVYDEVDFVMNTIRKLVREQGLRYRDFVLISRSDSVYSPLIDEISSLYNIPCYTDNRVAMTSLPFTVFMISSVKAALSFETEDIMRMAKTGLAGVDNSEISKVENYAYIWNVDGKKWLEKWNMNPDGLKSVTTEKEAERFKKEIDVINDIRERIILPLIKLREGLVGSPEQMCTALFRFIENCKVAETLKTYVTKLENEGYLQEVQLQSVGYDAFIKSLDKIVMSLDSSTISAQEFLRILTSVLSFETVGDIPHTLDQVMFGTADRIKPMRPKVVFLLGVNQDVFPSTVSDSGLLSVNEREQLIKGGINVADHGLNDCLDEKFLFYFSAACALEKVYICYSKSTMSGSALEPSIEIASIKENFLNVKVIEYGSELDLNDAETEAASFRKFAEHFRDGTKTVDAYKTYFLNTESFASRVDALEDFFSDKKPSITRESALNLYGDEISLSASKADDFSGCKFMYFCKYGIGAREIGKVDFDPLTRGNIVHFCLEQFVKNHFNDIGTLENDAIKNETFLLCDRYLDENATDKEAFDEKFKYMMEIVKDTVATLCIALNNEFAISSFRPKFCELKVADDQPVKGVDVYTDSGNRVTLTGYIDRVDVTEDGKVRVIDYKTGSKGDGLKLSELINGQNMQMLLYLYSLLKNGQELIKANVPAGVLYFPAKRSVADSKDFDYIRMNGVIADDIETVSQMEPLLEGKIIPAHKRPNGDSFYSTESMISQEAFKLLFRYVELLLKKIGNVLLSGDISPRPLKSNDKLKCEFCDYRAVCRFDPYCDFDVATDCKNQDALEMMKKEIEEVENGDAKGN